MGESSKARSPFSSKSELAVVDRLNVAPRADAGLNSLSLAALNSAHSLFLQLSPLPSFDHRLPPLRRCPPGRRLLRRRRVVLLRAFVAVVVGVVFFAVLFPFVLFLLLLLLLHGQPSQRVPIQPGPVGDRRQARQRDADAVDLVFECFVFLEEEEVEVEKMEGEHSIEKERKHGIAGSALF